jgi:hypothetical protein
VYNRAFKAGLFIKRLEEIKEIIDFDVLQLYAKNIIVWKLLE